MISTNRQLLLLFSQLTWPSSLVRERACDGIADLLLDPHYAEVTQSYLLRWMAAQKLESVAAIGLLPLLCAQMKDNSFNVPQFNEIWSSLTKPSLLSWLLLNELWPEHVVSLSKILSYSEGAPLKFEPNPFFTKHVKTFLPPIYDFWAGTIEERERIPFRRQWAYEWQLIVQCNDTKLSTNSLGFWARGRSEEERYASVETQLSEIYRSAYLRTLAWAVGRRALDRDNALFFAAQTSPVDLELWRLKPTPKPTWWPLIEEPTGEIDTGIGEIWAQVEELWQKQRTSDEKWDGNDWILASASGLVHQGATAYELDICGLFQKCHGPTMPNPEEIVNWYQGKNLLTAQFPTPLRFKGIINSQPINSFVEQFEDWTVAPIAGDVDVMSSSSRWQFWRLYRRIWLPTPYFGELPITFACHENALVARCGGEVIGKWNDWTDSFSEKMIDTIPPATGQYLMIPRQIIEEFAAATDSTFCWVCRLTCYYREKSYGPHKRFTDHRIFGASRIVKV